MQVLVEIGLGQQDIPERHVLKNQGIYRKKQSLLSDILSLLTELLFGH